MFLLKLALALVSPLLLGIVPMGCRSTIVVALPPRIDLQPYHTIGIVEFTSDPSDKLDHFATQKFMAAVQASQPNVRFLELGTVERVLTAIGRERLDADAIKVLGARFNVTTVFTGAYEISSLKPKVYVGQDLSSLNAGLTVSMSLALKHWDTRTGAIVWTNSRHGRWTVSNVRKQVGHSPSISVSDPKDRYGDFMEQLVYAVSEDFRIRYERRPAPKE